MSHLMNQVRIERNTLGLRFKPFNRLYLLLAFICLFTTDSYSLTLPIWLKNKTWRPLVAVGAGISWSSTIGNSAYFPIEPDVAEEYYQYSVNHTTQSSALGDVFLGLEWQFQPMWALQMGLGYQQASPFLAKGSYIQGADVRSQNTYFYDYGILIRQLLIEGKLLYSFKERYHPYVLGGIGSSFNKAYSYNTDVPINLAFTRIYSNNASSSFTYIVGVGLDYDVISSFRLGIGYRFTDVGNIKLGSAVIDTTPVNGTLSQSHLYANEILIQATWIA